MNSKSIFSIFLLFFVFLTFNATSQTLVLDGVNDNVTFPKTNDYNLGTGPFTVEMSFITNTPSRSDLMSFKKNGADDFGIFIGGDLKMKVYLNLGGVLQGNGGLVLEGTTTFSLGVMYHVAVTRDGAGNWTLYINGNIDATGFSNGDINSIDTPPFILLGANHNNVFPCCFYHNGEIDEFRIWNIERTQMEIQNSMNSVPGNSPGLLVYYNFDNVICGLPIDDLTPVGNDATLNGCTIVNPESVFCGDVVPISNNTYVNNLENYPSRPQYSFSGPEAITALPVSTCGEICITVSNRVGGNIDVFILTDAADASSSILWINGIGGTSCFTAEAGTEYYLVVDGLLNSRGTLQVEIQCSDACSPDAFDPDFNRCLVPSPADYAENLVSNWTFDDSSLDLEGNNDGVINGTGFSYVPAVHGNGIDLDGGVTYINAGNDPSLNMSGKSVTISAWFRVDAFTGFWQTLLSKGEGPNYRIAQYSNTDMLSYNGAFPDLQSTSSVNDGEFHHVVAVTVNGVDKRIYIDGELEDASNINTVIADTGTPLFIGENPQALSREWNGVIDDVAIWDKALTDCQIRTIYTSGRSIEYLSTFNLIPTLTEWAIGILALMFAIIGVVSIKRRSVIIA